MCVATSCHLAELPDRVPVIAQSTTLFCRAGTTSLKASVTPVPPKASTNSASVRLPVRTFLPFRSARPLISPLQKSTWAEYGHTPSTLMPKRSP